MHLFKSIRKGLHSLTIHQKSVVSQARAHKTTSHQFFQAATSQSAAMYKLHCSLRGKLAKHELDSLFSNAPKFKQRHACDISGVLCQYLLWWKQKTNVSKPTQVSIRPPEFTIWTDVYSTRGGGKSLIHKTLRVRDLVGDRTRPPNHSFRVPSGDRVPPSTNFTSTHKHPHQNRTRHRRVYNKQRRAQALGFINYLLKKIIKLCLKHHWSIRARHIAGHLGRLTIRNHIFRAESELSNYFPELPALRQLDT